MLFKCKMCGGDVIAQDGMAFGTCDSCGGTSTLPKANEERIVNLFNRANHLRRHHEFDKALSAYESILTEDPTNAEAHWCMVLCRYGIEYVEDPKTYERIPTCHRTQAASVLADADYLSALENAPDSYTKELYEEAATRIHEIQKDILAISANEEPYDVFICYKETTDGGSRTKDSTFAQDIYYHLTNDGLRVFFARITLEDKIGRKYEPYIFNALNTAKVMLVIGTKKEHFEAVWVKNEWSRFLALMRNDRSRILVPCYRDMDAYDIPEELSHFQAQDMGKIGFIQDFVRGVKKVTQPITPTPAPVQATTATTVPAGNADTLLKRAYIFLEDGDFTQANQYFERVLDTDPENAKAYIGKLCVEAKVRTERQLIDSTIPLTEYSSYKNAVRFADASTRATIEAHNQTIINRIAEEDYQQEVQRVQALLQKNHELEKYNAFNVRKLKAARRLNRVALMFMGVASAIFPLFAVYLIFVARRHGLDLHLDDVSRWMPLATTILPFIGASVMFLMFLCYRASNASANAKGRISFVIWSASLIAMGIVMYLDLTPRMARSGWLITVWHYRWALIWGDIVEKIFPYGYLYEYTWYTLNTPIDSMLVRLIDYF